jgi:anti-sigma B factor antagonist
VEIHRRFGGDVAILDLSGRFAVSSGETEILPLRSAISELIAQGRVFVAINLAGLASIDARGLGELVLSLTTLRRHGGGLKLVAPTDRVRRLVLVTRLNKVIPICSCEQEATSGLWR